MGGEELILLAFSVVRKVFLSNRLLGAILLAVHVLKRLFEQELTSSSWMGLLDLMTKRHGAMFKLDGRVISRVIGNYTTLLAQSMLHFVLVSLICNSHWKLVSPASIRMHRFEPSFCGL